MVDRLLRRVRCIFASKVGLRATNPAMAFVLGLDFHQRPRASGMMGYRGKIQVPLWESLQMNGDALFASYH